MDDGLKESHRQAIIRLFAAHPRVESVVLFGSRATGTYRPASDVDLALFGTGLSLDDLADLADGIERIPMAQQVDLLLFDQIENRALKEQIIQQGRHWFTR